MSRLVVLIDGVVFENRLQTGIWRIFYEVMSRTSDSVEYKLLLDCDPIQPIPDGVDVVVSQHRTDISHNSQIVSRVRRQLSIQRLRRTFSQSIWHSTFLTSDPRSSGRNVVSVYDMIAEEFLWAYPSLENQIKAKKQCLRDPNAVLTISHETKRLVIKHYPSLREKVAVASPGCEHLGSTNESLSVGKSKSPFVLFVGNRGHYKNFDCLVRALNSDQWPSGLEVVLVGKPLDDHEVKCLVAWGVNDKFRSLGYVSDKELGSLFRDATCFVFPSLGEGFGIPVLESQRNRCPTLLSDLQVFHEVAGEGAIYFDPHDPESLAACVGQVVSSNQNAMVQRGVENARRFRWDTTAEVTLRCYEEVWRR